MEFSGDWNETHPTADWSEARPQRPANPDLSFDLDDDLINWNQPILQQSDAGYTTRPHRGATQHGDTPSEQIRAPLQRPTAPFTPLMTDDVSNGAWDSQEGRPPTMNEKISQLHRRVSILASTVQDLSSTVQDLNSTVQSLGTTVRKLERTSQSHRTDQKNIERRFNLRIQSLDEYVETIAEWVDKCLKDHVGGLLGRTEPREQGEESESR